MTNTDVGKRAPERDPDIKGYDPNAKRTAGVIRFDPNVIGQTGLKHSGGWVTEEFLPALKGPAGRRKFREMADNCPVTGALLFAVTALFRSVTWTVQAADDSAKAEKVAAFWEECLDDMDMPLDAVMAEVASMFVYGFAPHEILWKKRVGPDETDPAKRSKFTDNKVGIRGLPLRKQHSIDRWVIDDATGEVCGLWQQPWSGTQVYIPIEKVLLFRTTEEGNNPEGRSILRNAYRPWYYKTRIEEIEAIGVERDLAGLPIVRIPSSYMDEDADPGDKAVYAAYVNLARGIKRDTNEGLVIPSDRKDGEYVFSVELLSTGGSRSMDTTKVLERYDRQIAMSALADFIFLGQSATGSFALSSDKTALFGQALGSFLKAVAGVFNRHLIPRWGRLNDIKAELLPKMAFEDVEPKNLAELASFVTSLAGAGAPMFPDRELENHLRKQGGLPPAPEEGSEDYALQRAQAPGMTLGPDGKPLPATAREDMKGAEEFNRAQPPGMPPQQWTPDVPGGAKKPAEDSDQNGVPDEDETR